MIAPQGHRTLNQRVTGNPIVRVRASNKRSHLNIRIAYASRNQQISFTERHAATNFAETKAIGFGMSATTHTVR